jgi:hypothetical protein
MKILLLALWLCIGAVPAFAQNQNQNQNQTTYRSAPAELIGVGIPTTLAVGGVLLGAWLLQRRRR